MLLELPLSTSILLTRQFATVSDMTKASWWGARILSCSFAMKLISSVPRSRRFVFPVSWPSLAYYVLFFAAAWLMPLTSEPLEMTQITLSCLGGEACIVSVGWLFVSLLRRFLALSERTSWRCPFFSSSLTSILSAMQSSVLGPWSLWKSHHRFGFQKESGALIFWGHLTCGPSASERWSALVLI